jgi:hypothetical protein
MSLSAGGALWLDLTRADARFLASASADGANWKQIGSWSAPAPQAPQGASQDDGTSSVWLPFTCAGLLVTGAPDVTQAPVFANLAVETPRVKVTGE